jgi:hypothetical protein
MASVPGGGLCLADYVLDGDHVALFVTTAGEGSRSRCGSGGRLATT